MLGLVLWATASSSTTTSSRLGLRPFKPFRPKRAPHPHKTPASKVAAIPSISCKIRRDKSSNWSGVDSRASCKNLSTSGCAFKLLRVCCSIPFFHWKSKLAAASLFYTDHLDPAGTDHASGKRMVHTTLPHRPQPEASLKASSFHF